MKTKSQIQQEFRDMLSTSGLELSEIAKKTGVPEARLDNFMKLDILPNIYTYYLVSIAISEEEGGFLLDCPE